MTDSKDEKVNAVPLIIHYEEPREREPVELIIHYEEPREREPVPITLIRS